MSANPFASPLKQMAAPKKRVAEYLPWVFGALLVVNLAITSYIALGRGEPASPKESETVVAQADKLYAMMKDYHAELLDVAGVANYPSDEEKQAGKNAVKRIAVDLELARLALARLDERRDRESLLNFLTVACGAAPTTGECKTLEPPSFAHIDAGKFEGNQFVAGKESRYANTSQLESMHDDFVVLLTAMLRDAK